MDQITGAHVQIDESQFQPERKAVRESATGSGVEPAPIRTQPQSTCFVCGPAHQTGLRIRFEPAGGGDVYALWIPAPAWEGFEGIIHGGIVSTVLDVEGRLDRRPAGVDSRIENSIPPAAAFRRASDDPWLDCRPRPAPNQDGGYRGGQRWPRIRPCVGDFPPRALMQSGIRSTNFRQLT